MTAIYIFFKLTILCNSNFGIGVSHVKRQLLTYFCDVISLLAQVFIVWPCFI